MEHEAARPKGTRAQSEQPLVEPMRPTRYGEVRRNPSTDQKRQRREVARKSATVLNTSTQWLNPGDKVRTPTGQTMTINRRRNHEHSSLHYYLDTDHGTMLAHRDDPWEVVPHNSQQQSSPGFGVPGGNTNTTPFGGSGGASGPSNPGGAHVAPSNETSKTECPNCGAKGTLRRSGDHYRCSSCGFTEQFGAPEGNTLSDSRRLLRGYPDVKKTFSTINDDMSAIARRARLFVLDPKEST